MYIDQTGKLSTLSIGDKEKILRYTQERFFKEGFQKISMDEIAKELSMSKSTLYKHFPSKLDLVSESTKMLISEVKVKIKAVISSGGNAVDKFTEVIRILTRTITTFNDKWLSDLQHHAPHIWIELDETRKVLMYENISKIIIQGQKEELIKKYPPEIVITLITGAMRGIVNPQFLISTSFSYDEAVSYAFKILLGGILTEKGNVILEKSNLWK
jgi:AcrR family transcriptional regulator